jgi:cold shock CspA family protein
MHNGTICDLDKQGKFGLIDADDGTIVCFNRHNVAMQGLDDLKIGMKVAFFVDNYAPGAHVTAVQLQSAHGADN